MRALIGVPTSPYRSDFGDMELDGVPSEVLNYYWALARLNQKIYDSIRRAGGVPIELLPTRGAEEIAAVAARLDGFIFSGGDDIHPRFYGEEMNGSIAPYEERDLFELELFKQVLETGKPVLGICRGAQLLNVALGGTLYQHLAAVDPEWTLHDRADVINGCVHPVEVLEPNFFRGWERKRGARMDVNSMHHQAVKKLAAPLVPLAVAEDGLIEAFKLPGHKYLTGVQWHPECPSGEDALQAGLFETVVSFSNFSI